jgi:peptidoglycan hydrolase-like protein with peptidoglycan-binding domain
MDGTLGPQTQKALRWFQQTKGLLATGALDEKTLEALELR